MSQKPWIKNQVSPYFYIFLQTYTNTEKFKMQISNSNQIPIQMKYIMLLSSINCINWNLQLYTIVVFLKLTFHKVKTFKNTYKANEAKFLFSKSGYTTESLAHNSWLMRLAKKIAILFQNFHQLNVF